MRSVLMVIIAAFVCACGQTQSSAASDKGGAQATDDTAQSGDAVVESETEFLARCTRETIAANPQSGNWAAGACAQIWPKVVAAGPMAEAILAAEPARAVPVDVATLSGRLGMVRWSGARAVPPAIAAGQLGDLSASISRAPAQLAFSWDRDGDIVPYDLEQALRARGAQLTLVGCMSYGGPFDVSKAFRVTAPGRAAFGVTIYSMDAAVAGAYATFNASADLSGQPPTLARLRADPQGGEWNAACPT